MSRRRLLRTLIVAALVSLSAAPAALANEQAGAYRDITNGIDGVKGVMGIRTDPATVAGVSYVHPTQIDTGFVGADFVAIGTYNGMGTAGGSHDCADDFDPKWTIYADGITSGVYWCYAYTQDAYTTGATPSFQIYYDFCSPSGPASWVLTFAGVQRRCVQDGTTQGSRASVFLETVGTTIDRNIDVKYSGLMINPTNSATWQNFTATGSAAAPNYTVNIVSDTAVNAYLAPLD
jgi:hypothetical protein